jgi:hypothetical protein
MAQFAPMIGTALEYAPYAISAGKTAYAMGQKYAPHVKRLANNLFSAGKRKSAMQYVKGLTKAKGLQKLVTKDLPSVAKSTSKLISSGKLMKGVKEVAGDARTVLNASQKLIGDKNYSRASALIDRGQDQATRYHDIANSYNEQGKQLASQFYDRN